MSAVTLRPDLLEFVAKDAEREARSVDEIVNEAVEQYLRERERTRLDAEIAAYERMHPELEQRHLGEWVAIREQALIDHDGDGTALHQRIRARYGNATILLRRVGEQPTEELWFRSPRIEKKVG